jgi:hypothetical protein
MSAGLFVSSCPECGGELAIDLPGGTNTCVPCRRSYLNRFGHLIPVQFHDPLEQDALSAPIG